MHVFIDTTGVVNLEKAKTNIKYQKIMFASVSHEFRTPLNAIMNSFQFIEDQFNQILLYFHKHHKGDYKFIQNNSQRIKKFVGIGNNSSALLMNLIEDILDMSKIEAGTFVINNTNFMLKPMIEDGVFKTSEALGCFGAEVR
jgi:two-component system, cell cycle sensor histidine kinase PleC